MPKYRYIKNPSVRARDPIADFRLYTHNSLSDRLEALRVEVSGLKMHRNPNENFDRTLDDRPVSDFHPTLVARVNGVMSPHPELSEPDWEPLIPSYHYVRTKGLTPLRRGGVYSYVPIEKGDDEP